MAERRTADASNRKRLAIAVLLLALAADLRGQTRPAPALAGVAVDATGAVLPNATVELTNPAHATVQTTTDAQGGFRFEGVPPGRYELRISFEGFQPTTLRVTIGARAPAALRVTLPLAGVRQEITVSNQA